MKYLFFSLVFLLLFSACKKQLTDTFDDVPNRLVLQGTLNPDSNIVVYIGKLRKINDTRDTCPTGTTVKVYDNGNDIGAFTPHPRKATLFQSFTRPIAGHTYKIEVSAPDYPTVTAEVTVPERVMLPPEELYFESVAGGPFKDWSDVSLQKFNIKWQDPNNIKNYYEVFAKIRAEFSVIEPSTRFLISNQDVLNQEGYKEYQENTHLSSIFFSDKILNGQVCNLQVYMTGIGSDIGNHLLVFRSCSESYYLYRKSLFFNGITRPVLQNNNVESILFLGDPVQLYSNVENGYGAWIACNEDWRTLYYKP